MTQKMGGDDNTVAFLASLGAATGNQITTIDEEGNPLVPIAVDPPVDSNTASIDDDFKLARDNIIAVTQVASAAITKLADIADQSQHPRAFEVLGSLIKTVLDAQQDIIALHKKREDLKPGSIKKTDESSDTVQGNKVTNNLFVGTPAQLAQALEEVKKQNG